MAGITGIETRLREAAPVLDVEHYVFVGIDSDCGGHAEWQPLASFAEREGLTPVLRQTTADAEQLFDRAIKAGISILPGQVASPRSVYTNFVRLSFGHPWCEATEDAIKWLGDEVRRMALVSPA